MPRPAPSPSARHRIARQRSTPTCECRRCAAAAATRSSRPAVQRERIAAWAAAHGHRIAQVHEELDVSGGTVDRPKLNAVMARIEAGETGGVVVFKLDRFGRTLVDSLGLIERIERAGGTFASVSDGFDLATETGRLVLRIMLSLAEFELERIRGNWREARERAVARGLHLTATLPFGYQRDAARRRTTGLEPHPVERPDRDRAVRAARGRRGLGGPAPVPREQGRQDGARPRRSGRCARCATSSATTSTSASPPTASSATRARTSR